MTRNAVWALSNLCRGKSPPPEFAKVNTLLVGNCQGSVGNESVFVETMLLVFFFFLI